MKYHLSAVHQKTKQDLHEFLAKPSVKRLVKNETHRIGEEDFKKKKSLTFAKTPDEYNKLLTQTVKEFEEIVNCWKALIAPSVSQGNTPT